MPHPRDAKQGQTMTEAPKTFMGFPIKTAPPLEIERAKKYGKRIEGKDGDTTVVAYQWGNDVYIVEEAHAGQPRS